MGEIALHLTAKGNEYQPKWQGAPTLPKIKFSYTKKKQINVYKFKSLLKNIYDKNVSLIHIYIYIHTLGGHSAPGAERYPKLVLEQDLHIHVHRNQEPHKMTTYVEVFGLDILHIHVPMYSRFFHMIPSLSS